MAEAGLIAKFEVKEYTNIQRGVTELLLYKANEQNVASRAEAITRDILPKTDLNFPSEVWMYDLSAGTPSAYNQVVANVDLDSKKLIGIWGVIKRGDPIVSAIKFMKGDAETTDIWQIDGLKDWEICIVREPEDAVIYDSKDKVNIYYYLNAAGYAQLVLLGKTVEKKGKTVSGMKLAENEMASLRRLGLKA